MAPTRNLEDELFEEVKIEKPPKKPINFKPYLVAAAFLIPTAIGLYALRNTPRNDLSPKIEFYRSKQEPTQERVNTLQEINAKKSTELDSLRTYRIELESIIQAQNDSIYRLK